MKFDKELVLQAAEEDGTLAVILNDICESTTKSQLEMGQIFLQRFLSIKLEQRQSETGKEAA